MPQIFFVVLEINRQSQVVNVSRKNAAFPIQGVVNQRDFLARVRKSRQNVRQVRTPRLDFDVGVTKFFVAKIFQRAVNARHFQFVLFGFGIVLRLRLYQFARHEFFQRRAEQLNLARLPAELDEVVIFQLAALVNRIQQLPNYVVDVGVEYRLNFKDAERHVRQIFRQRQAARILNRQLPLVERNRHRVIVEVVVLAIDLPISRRLVMVALHRQKNAHYAVILEEFLLDSLRHIEQEIIIVADEKIFVAVARLPIFETRRQNLFRVRIRLLKILINRTYAEFVNVSENVQAEILEQIFQRRYHRRLEIRLPVEKIFLAVKILSRTHRLRLIGMLLAENLDELQFQQLQNSIRQIVAAEIR